MAPESEVRLVWRLWRVGPDVFLKQRMVSGAGGALLLSGSLEGFLRLLPVHFDDRRGSGSGLLVTAIQF